MLIYVLVNSIIFLLSVNFSLFNQKTVKSQADRNEALKSTLNVIVRVQLNSYFRRQNIIFLQRSDRWKI